MERMINSAEPFFSSRSSIRRSIDVIATYAIARQPSFGKSGDESLQIDDPCASAKTRAARTSEAPGVERAAS
jgi:hypothetical protein